MCWILLGVIMAWAETVYGTHPDSGAHPAPESVSEKQPPCATPLPEIPEMFKAEPAVLEAERVVRGRSIAHFIPDGRVVK
jgi:hypothetical protein